MTDWEKQWLVKGKEGRVKKKRRSSGRLQVGRLGNGLDRVGSVGGIGERLAGGGRRRCSRQLLRQLTVLTGGC